MDRVKRIWYLSPMRAAKILTSLRIRAVSPEPSLLAHTSSESRGTFRQKARSLAPLNGWACAVKVCHDGMLEDTNSLDGAQVSLKSWYSLHIIDTAQTSSALKYSKVTERKDNPYDCFKKTNRFIDDIFTDQKKSKNAFSVLIITRKDMTHSIISIDSI